MIVRLWLGHLLPRGRSQIGLLLALMVISGFDEVASLGAVLPFLAVIAVRKD